MPTVWPVYASSALLALLLIIGAVTDIRERVISNRLNMAIALSAPLYWWATGVSLWPGVGIQIGMAFAVFVVFALLFALGLMGGGDVKLLGALALWLPWQEMGKLLVIMAIVGGFITVAALVYHRLRRREGQPEVPYGVAIALAGLWVLGELNLNIFS
ncbi:MAG: prepilin peptidase [Sphingobium sp.]|nr:prepilin peptidase [Sphingobium sp.]